METAQLRINSFLESHCTPDWSWQSRKMKDFDLWTVLGGSGTLAINGSLHPATSGSFFLLNPGDIATGRHNPEKPLWVIAIHFDFLSLSGKCISNEYRNAFPSHGFFPEKEFCLSLLRRLEEEYKKHDREKSEFWMNTILEEINRCSAAITNTETQSLKTKEMDSLCLKIKEYPSQLWRVASMAKTLDLSRHHFCRLFKKLKGITPQDFVVNARIDAAKGLLKLSDHPISRIAHLLGYPDIYFFSKQFKKKTGVTPTEFRRRG